MIVPDIPIHLRDGRAAVLRTPRTEDAAALLDCLRDSVRETQFLLLTPEELTMTVEDEVAFIEGRRSSGVHLMLLCEVEGRLAGSCDLSFSDRFKTRHRATIGISLRKAYWGLGIGTAMFREMIAAAQARGVAQLELEFIEGNDRGRALYEKMGFRIAGVRPDAIRQPDGSSLCEYWMIKRL